jgi:predicted nucleotidyltransferase
MERNRAVLDRFRAACQAHDSVLAAFLGGSLAAGTADEESDLDVYAVIDPARYERFLAEREAFLRSWGDPVFSMEIRNFENLGFDMILFAMADGVDGELALATPENMMAIHGGPHEVLVDKTGILEGVEFPLLTFDERPTAAAVEAALAWFWWEIRVALKSWVRGKWWGTGRMLERVRERLIFLAQAAGATDFRSSLSGTFAPVEKEALADAIAEAVRRYLEWGPNAAASTGAPYPSGLVEVNSNRVARTLGQHFST